MFQVMRRTIQLCHPQLRITCILHTIPSFTETQIEMLQHIHYTSNQTTQHEGRLQGVGPHNRFHTTFERISEDQQKNKDGRNNKRHMQLIHHQLLQYPDHKIEPCCSTNSTGNDKQQRSGFIARHSKALLQIMINRSQLQPIIKRKENIRHTHISDKISEDHHQVRHPRRGHRSRNRYESHTRKGGSDHPKGDDIPGRIFIPQEESLISGTAGGIPGNPQ